MNTANEFEATYQARLRQLGPAGRLKVACGLYEFARRFLTVNLRKQHPDWNEAQIQAIVQRRLQPHHSYQ